MGSDPRGSPLAPTARRLSWVLPPRPPSTYVLSRSRFPRSSSLSCAAASKRPSWPETPPFTRGCRTDPNRANRSRSPRGLTIRATSASSTTRWSCRALARALRPLCESRCGACRGTLCATSSRESGSRARGRSLGRATVARDAGGFSVALAGHHRRDLCAVGRRVGFSAASD